MGIESLSTETIHVYQIQEDGQSKLWKATTMQDAIKLAENDYVREEQQSAQAEGTEQEWRAFYHASLLESCTLIGELQNP